MLQAYHDILVAIDDFKAAQQAFNEAVHIANLNHGHILLLSVLDIWNKNYEFDSAKSKDDFTQKIFEQTEKHLTYLQKKAEYLNVPNCDIHIRFGNPKRIIAHDFSQDHHIDLIILAATSRNLLTQITIGSVTDYVIRNAITDVLTIRTNHQSS
ncbi:MAG: universal stress protein [Lactobacillus sp.]|nr:MAG: universal stress protein [Lactobacillus sp.]